MKKRLLLIGLALSLAATACSAAEEASTTSTSPPSTLPEMETPEAVALVYALEAGTEYQYEVTLDQRLIISADGDPEVMGDEDMPGEAELDITGTALISYLIAEGPEAGTFEVTITGEFTDLTVSGTMDGEPVDSDEIPDFAAIEPVEATVVVDEHGNPVGEESVDDPFGLFGASDPFGGAGLAPGIDPGQFVGPPLSEEEVTVGDTWSEEIETPGFGGDPTITVMESTVTGVEELDGVEVFVIDTSGSTSPVEVDLADFFAGFFGAFMPEDADEEEAAELEEMLGQLVFLIRVEDAVSEARTWFDFEAGLARRSDTTATASISMQITLPDESTGELVGLSMEMTIDQSLDYRLVSAPEA